MSGVASGWPGHHVLQVPVPALEPFVRERTAHYDRSYLAEDTDFVQAHVTALGPFYLSPTVADLAAVAEVAAATRPFAYELADVATFPDGTIHLTVADPVPFADLTARLCARFPELVPYEGRFPDVFPHLTLDATVGGVTAETTRRRVSHLLPVRGHATHLDLAWYEPWACRRVTRWSLG